MIKKNETHCCFSFLPRLAQKCKMNDLKEPEAPVSLKESEDVNNRLVEGLAPPADDDGVCDRTSDAKAPLSGEMINGTTADVVSRNDGMQLSKNQQKKLRRLQSAGPPLPTSNGSRKRSYLKSQKYLEYRARPRRDTGKDGEPVWSDALEDAFQQG